jgi:radical SAM superfamily enzyme YgiQ (UPF0313 family)
MFLTKKKKSKRQHKKRILIVNCWFEELRVPMRRKTKLPQSMATAFLAGVFSSRRCNIKLYDEIYSGPLEDEHILAFPDMLVLTGLNSTFDRMLHITAYVKTKNKKAIVVAGGPAIRALPEYSKKFFDYRCIGDVEQLGDVVEDALGKDYVSTNFLETGQVIPRFDLAYWTTIMNYVESSRNCYFRCSYCSLTAEKGKYQPYAIEYLRQQFMALGRQSDIHFLDNNFASNNKQFVLDRFSLLKELSDAGYFKAWAAEVTSDFFLDDENLELARDSGCKVLFSGVESFDKKALLNLKKYQNTYLPQVNTIKKCLNAGITFLYGIMFDLTTRPISELKEELDFIIGSPDITLPAFISLAIPLLGTPFFYECLDQKLFLPNLKLRDMDGATLTLKPRDSMGEAVKFVRDIQFLNGYKSRIMRHMKEFFKKYKKVLPWRSMGVAQYCAFLLCTPKLSSAGSDIGRVIRNGLKQPPRTFIGSTEPLDSVYRPAFCVDSRYAHYFKPTMLTDEKGYLSEPLHADLLMN